MKGGFNGLKGKQISLITIVLMSTTILMWAWEKNPLLITSAPSETGMQVSPELRDVPVVSSVSSGQELQIANGVGTLAQKDAPKEELRLGVASRKSDEISSDQVTNPVEKNGISLSASKESVNMVGEKASNLEERTSVDRRHTEKTEENSDLQKQNVALVAPVDPAYTNTSIGEHHEDKLTTLRLAIQNITVLTNIVVPIIHIVNVYCCCCPFDIDILPNHVYFSHLLLVIFRLLNISFDNLYNFLREN